MGELHPLPVPEGRWDTISVDFIVELPEAHSFDAVMVVVDFAGKHAHFILTHTTITAFRTACNFLNNVWKLHSLPLNVLSDQGPQFVAEFMRELYCLLGIKLSASTAYHLQSNGQTKQVNQELEQYIRLFVSERQDDWDELLPLGEFQYNNHVHASTQHTLFLLDTGRIPQMGFEPNATASRTESVNEFVGRMKSTMDEARAALLKAKDDMARYYNQRRVPAPVYALGDKVFLDSSDIKTTCPSPKLVHHYLGPYLVVRTIGSHAYRLKLPQSMCCIHPIFHVIKLLHAPQDPIPRKHVQLPPDPELIDGVLEYEVEEIKDSQLSRNTLQYLVVWKGYGYEEHSWVNEKDVSAPDLVTELYRKNPGALQRIHAIHATSFAF